MQLIQKDLQHSYQCNVTNEFHGFKSTIAVRISAIMGFALTHMALANDRYSRMLLTEIGKPACETCKDSYCSTVGLVLGLINLGCGFPQNKGRNDLKLLAYINGTEVDVGG